MSAAPLPLPASAALRRPELVRGRGGRRAFVDRAIRGLSLGATVLCLAPLVAILVFVTANGLPGISLDLLTRPSRALGVGGGAASAILGSIQMVAVAAAIAIPLGILAAVYVAEFAGPRAARIVRFAGDVMVGIPSILIGLFVFSFLVLPFRRYNAFAGSVALAVLMVPVIMRTSEEILRLVPATLREASYALGVARWRTVLSVVAVSLKKGVLTGVMLAVARAAGETAPLLFTALGSRLVNVGDFSRPMDAMPIFIYNNARQPYPVLNEQAWAVAFLLLLFVLVVNVLVRARTWGRRMT